MAWMEWMPTNSPLADWKINLSILTLNRLWYIEAHNSTQHKWYSRGSFNINMPYYQERNSHYIDKMVLRPYHHCNRIPSPRKMVFILNQVLDDICLVTVILHDFICRCVLIMVSRFYVLHYLCRVHPKNYAHSSCFVVFCYGLLWFKFYPYPSGLLHCHWGNHMIAPVPVNQPWNISVHRSYVNTFHLWFPDSWSQ